MFLVMSPFVINVPTRDLLVPYTKQSFQIMVGITIAVFVNTKHHFEDAPTSSYI